MQALYDAMPNQIHLFNLSLEGPQSGMLRDQLKAQSQSALLIVAAGNDAHDMNAPQNIAWNGTFRQNDGSPLPNVMIVGALMDTGKLTPASNYGNRVVESAPQAIQY